MKEETLNLLEMVKGMKPGDDTKWTKESQLKFFIYCYPCCGGFTWRGRPNKPPATAEEATAALEKFLNRR